MANKLQYESSTYLLHHANNPVDWHPWNEETLELAKKTNKPMLISIGYAACHWCHVMEHECFEDESVARVMNEHFINIKVDREERPDVDQIYMTALQIMTGSGGWPLNVVALPDGRPFWGATYVPADRWVKVLSQLSDLLQNDPAKVHEYADKLSKGISEVSLAVPETGQNESLNPALPTEALMKWKPDWDLKWGGRKGAPKFMMPVNLEFLLTHNFYFNRKDHEEYLKKTLYKMSFGGIYDHLAGGFARYSVDEKWHVPHFEKMLYDNAQLVSLYAKAYAHDPDPWYEKIVMEICDFMQRELASEEHIFYSALDADSLDANGNSKEGAYYTWTKEELTELLGDEYPLFSRAFHIDEFGYWEDGQYVPIRDQNDDDLAASTGMSAADLRSSLKKAKARLLQYRNKRPRPQLDDKSLTSWNAMAITAFTDAYKVFGKKEYIETALAAASFIRSYQLTAEGSLWHTFKAGKSAIKGFLEDYAFVIQAFINLYETTQQEAWLSEARSLTLYVIDNFMDDRSGLFFFTDKSSPTVVSKTLEKSDNVIPASNSVMAHNLFELSRFYDHEKFRNMAVRMLQVMENEMITYPYSHGNWLRLQLKMTQPFYEIVVTGKNALEKAREINSRYLPSKIIAASATPSSLPLFKGRQEKEQTQIHLCLENHCKLPVSEVEEVYRQIPELQKPEHR
ncbi:thioredoxin domain-containing protein [Robertkochia aurantiaca]|uniref:thioredoxin domain-containing protein n=1 Tax=Robertkochia aurantiaca TaxID=2873700 RepID=UPI001CCD8E7C|nr:thioredoxin domain-containing protein [Robertkochia sp. 3YJGBD-33]